MDWQNGSQIIIRESFPTLLFNMSVFQMCITSCKGYVHYVWVMKMKILSWFTYIVPNLWNTKWDFFSVLFHTFKVNRKECYKTYDLCHFSDFLHFYSAFLSSFNILPKISVCILQEEECHKGLEQHEKKRLQNVPFSGDWRRPWCLFAVCTEWVPCLEEVIKLLEGIHNPKSTRKGRRTELCSCSNRNWSLLLLNM